MSNLITNVCRSLQITPTRKCVLMALADHADDDGICWPSITWLSDWTCFSRTTVAESLKWLQAAELIGVRRDAGRYSEYQINVSALQSAAFAQAAIAAARERLEGCPK